MTSQRMETLALKRCARCTAELEASHNFCRWCGTRQGAGAVTAASSEDQISTKAFCIDQEFQTFSSLLVKTLTQSIATKATPLTGSRFGARVAGALIAIPIWLLIVLLSPLDAYAAVRAASAPSNYR